MVKHKNKTALNRKKLIEYYCMNARNIKELAKLKQISKGSD